MKILFTICLYVSICIGIYIKAQNAPNYSLSWIWSAIFPFLYIYAFFVLLNSKTINPFRLIRLFCSRIAIYLLMESIKETEAFIKNTNTVHAKYVVRPHSSKSIAINQNIKKVFSYT